MSKPLFFLYSFGFQYSELGYNGSAAAALRVSNADRRCGLGSGSMEQIHHDITHCIQDEIKRKTAKTKNMAIIADCERAGKIKNIMF
jgi:hypothetical protein